MLVAVAAAQDPVAPHPTVAPRIAEAVIHLRVQQEPVAPELDALYRRLDVVGPGHGGVRTTTGTAFVTGAPPVLVTNHHVVAGAREIVLEGPDGAPFATIDDPQAVRVDHRADVAVIAVPGLDRAGLPLGRAGVGAAITVIGFPDDGPLAARRGQITGEEVRGIVGRPPRRLLRTDARVDRGLSGAPVLDADGRVVGLAVAGSRPTSDLGGDGLLVPGEPLADAVTRLTGPCPAPRLGARVGPDGGVRAVAADGAAARAGVLPDDALVGDAWDALGPCATTWTVARDGVRREVPAGVRPDDRALRVTPDGRVAQARGPASLLGLDAGDEIVEVGGGTADVGAAVAERAGPLLVRVARKGWVVLPAP